MALNPKLDKPKQPPKRRGPNAGQGQSGLRRKHRKIANTLAAWRESAIAYAVPLEDLPDEDPGDVMQMLINRVTRLLRYAAAQHDALKPGPSPNQDPHNLDYEQWVTFDENGNLIVTPSYWIHREHELTNTLAHLTEAAQKLDLSARRTRIKEAEVTILGEALRRASVTAGLTTSQQKALGAALREELATIEQTPSEENNQYANFSETELRQLPQKAQSSKAQPWQPPRSNGQPAKERRPRNTPKENTHRVRRTKT